jgi:hypothetical protein
VPSRGLRAGAIAEGAAWAPRTTSRGVSRAPGTRTRRTRTAIRSARPVRCFDTRRGLDLRTILAAEATGRPPLRLRAPSETCRPSPAKHRPVGRVAPTRNSSCRAASPELSCPTTLAGAAASLQWAADPSAAAGHVRGLDTPLAAFTASPPDAEASERPWASPSKAFPSLASAPPLGAAALLMLPSPRPSRRRSRRCGHLQGLPPAASPCSRRMARATRPSMPSWDFPLQSSLPILSGARF